jgi:hypothetical protein
MLSKLKEESCTQDAFLQAPGTARPSLPLICRGSALRKEDFPFRAQCRRCLTLQVLAHAGADDRDLPHLLVSRQILDPMREIVAIDYLYVANWSLWKDVKILLRTVPHVLGRRGL